MGKALKGNHYVHQNLFYSPILYMMILVLEILKFLVIWPISWMYFVGFHLDLLPSVVVINDVVDFPIFGL